jgi:hypothetical protein
MRSRALLFVALLITVWPGTARAAIEWEATFTLSGGQIHGHTPIPQNNGFDCVFSKLGNDPANTGTGITVESIEIESLGVNFGEVVNWDWEIFVGPTPFGLPEGQFLETHVDPVSGYARTAPVHVQFNINTGSRPDYRSFAYSAQYNFETSTASASPTLHHTWDVYRSTFDSPDGLYAQVFAWTGDNRNVGIIFDEFTLTIRGTAESLVSEVPEPAETTAGVFPLLAVGLLWSQRAHRSPACECARPTDIPEHRQLSQLLQSRAPTLLARLPSPSRFRGPTYPVQISTSTVRNLPSISPCRRWACDKTI